MDYNDRDFKELEKSQKTTGFLTLITKNQNSNSKPNLTIPEFNNHSFNLKKLTKKDWINFFENLKTEEFFEYIGIDNETRSKKCNLNAIEIALHMLKNLKNCHIINFAFSYTLEYNWGSSDMGLMDIEKKFDELEILFKQSSVVFENFIFKECNLERHSKFCVVTGGLCVFLVDFEFDVNK